MSRLTDEQLAAIKERWKQQYARESDMSLAQVPYDPSVVDYQVAAGDVRVLLAENASLRAELADIADSRRRIVAEQCRPDEKHCACVPPLHAEIDRLNEELTVVAKRVAAGINALRASTEIARLLGKEKT